jgi:hypothetical protein
MNLFLMTIAVMMAVAFIGTAGWGILRCAPADSRWTALRAEWPWFAKGLVVPFVIWALMNVGLSFELQPFMPRIQAAQNAGLNWAPIFLRVLSSGLLIISSYWAAITLIWLLIRGHHNLEPEWKLEFRATCFTGVILMGLPAALILFLGGWPLIGVATVLVATAMVGYTSPILHRPKRRPRYSRAIARIKFGNYSAAENEILRQLEANENDFDGWMMLAELQATRFNELDEAEKIILDVCVQPDTTPSQISTALHKLADWQITLTANPEAAARSLRLICDRLPESHLAMMAAARIAQLPTNQQYHEQRNPKPIPVPELPSIMNSTSRFAAGRAETDAALAQVNQLTEALTRNPDSVSDRERLARLLAEPLGKADLAIEQIELLLGLGNQPAVKRAEWLALIANWQLQLQHDETAARATLEKIIAEFPHTPHAFTAQRRLNLLKSEATIQKTKR